MKYPATLLMLILATGIFLAGCTQPAAPGQVAPDVPVTTAPATGAVMPVPTAAATTVPQEVVTIVRYVSQVRDIKDPELLFGLQVPVEWNISSYRLMNTDRSDYRTDLVGDQVFSIYTYTIPQNQDQTYRDEFRQWSPAPAETTVAMNGITYDRFESSSDGKTRVSYVVRKSSANERGYANVLVFTARDSNRFEKEDFEKVVSSFRYFSARSAGTEPGDEIPLYDLSGNPLPRKAGGGGSLAWGEWEGDSSGGDSSGGSSPDYSSDGSSSGGGSSGGCGCGG